MYNVLEQLNFGHSFINWVKTLYDDPTCCIKNNGYFSRNIAVFRGIRQGCPVSALLFILAVEIMSLKIRQEGSISGLSIPNSDLRPKVLQYADDGILCLNNEQEMRKAIDIVHPFGSLTGLQLNISKCEGLWLGNMKHRQINCNLFGIKWPLEPIRCLGIYIGYDYIAKKTLNWDDKIENIRKLLVSWKKRELTLFGKIVIIKQLAVPKILFSATLLAVPKGIIVELNAMFYEFIWGKIDKVKRNVLINDYENGGLKMVDIESLFSSVKASWIIRLVNAKADDIWTMVARFYLKQNDNDLLYRLNCTDTLSLSLLRDIPMFYKEVYESYMKAKCITYDVFCNTILDQPLWGNNFVYKSVGKKKETLYFKHWIDCGIIRIGNLRFINGIMDTEFIYGKVRKKHDIFSEISIIRNALRPFKHLILNHEAEADTSIPLFQNPRITKEMFSDEKSNFFYKCIIDKKISTPTEKEAYWQNVTLCNDIDFKKVYNSKF